MSLSNWDTMVVNEKGQPINGSVTFKNGVTVSFYKNWLYVRDPKAWTSDCGFVDNVVMQINDGEVTYKGVHILAWHGPQEGVYAVVYSGWDKEAKGMLGCGVSGYNLRGRWTGVTKTSLKWFHSMFNKKVTNTFDYSLPPKKAGGKMVHKTFKSVDYAISVPDLFHKLNLRTSGLRFNQGDAYFAKVLHKKVPATPAGKSHIPVLEQMCINGKDKP